MTYANFWQRLWAALLDFLILMPLIGIQMWLGSLSRTAALAVLVPMSCLYFGYTVYCHGRFGQTIGKRVVGIQVVRVDGEPIGWREAWVRSSVEGVFMILSWISSMIALSTISDEAYNNLTWSVRYPALEALMPRWSPYADILNQVWMWSEMIVMLFNAKRRALHDFLAGTVVVTRVPQESIRLESV